jgi:hypothetical protein
MAGAILPGDLRDHVDITGHESILWCGHSCSIAPEQFSQLAA